MEDELDKILVSAEMESTNKGQAPLKLDDLFQSKGRVRILQLLAQRELNISAIAQQTKLNHNAVRYHLKALMEDGLVQEKIFGRIRIYRFRLEEPRAQELKRLFEFWAQKVAPENKRIIAGR